MSKDLNNVTIIGRLTKDPEIRYLANGNAVCGFSIANNNSYTKDGNIVNDVNYFDVNVFGSQAFNCEKYIKKGSQVAISGSLKQSRWNDKTTGQGRSKVEITANSVQFLDSKNDSKKEPEQKDPWESEKLGIKADNSLRALQNELTDEDIPF